MRLFDLPNAKAFAAGFGAAGATGRGSPDDCLSVVARQRSFKEGTTEFDEVRDAMLRHGELGLLLAASNVRRALGLMTVASAPWAHVTLYYGAWFASSAIMAMLGGYLHHYRWHLSVEGAGLGGLSLKATPRQSGSQTREGSHQRFWRELYDGLRTFEPWVPAPHKVAAHPANGDPLWMVTERNLVNYKLHVSEERAIIFGSSFDALSFPGCLAGPIATQYGLSINLLGLAFWLAAEVGLSTNALDRYGLPGSTRQHLIASLVLDEDGPAIAEPRLRVYCA